MPSSINISPPSREQLEYEREIGLWELEDLFYKTENKQLKESIRALILSGRKFAEIVTKRRATKRL